MEADQVFEFFGGQRATARALGITVQSVHAWAERGVPELRQYQIERLSGGQLRISPEMLARSPYYHPAMDNDY